MLRDLRYAIRTLITRPGFTVIVIFLLALGIGANTAIFSVVNAVLLKPLPYPEPERLFIIGETNPQQKTEAMDASYPNYLEWKARTQVFEQIAAFNINQSVLTGLKEPTNIPTILVSANLFTLLGKPPVQGRTFTEDEDRPGGAAVVIVSHRFWQKWFAGDPDFIGKTVKLDDRPFTVIGIMPPDFQFLDEQAELWMPLGHDAQQPYMKNRAVHILTAIGRLKGGSTLTQAQSEMNTVMAGIQQQYPGEDPEHTVKVVSLADRLTGEVKTALWVLLGAVAFVLLIACTNLANLHLNRAMKRQREFAIRTALGASRGVLIRQLLTESLLLALIGGCVGVLLAMWGVDVLAAKLPEGFPHAQAIGIDKTVLSFALGLSVLTGILFGSVPAVKASKTDINDALKSGGNSFTGSGRNRFRNALVIAEIALSFVLLIGAGLMVKSFWKLTNVNPGFQPDHLLTMTVSLPSLKYTKRQQVIDYYKSLPDRLETLPGVSAVSAVNVLPINGDESHGELSIEGRPFNPGEAPPASYRRILPNYFRAMGIPLKSGREFDERDSGNTPNVVIINETMARRYWDNLEDAIGKRIKVGPAASEPFMTIVGVVGDVKHTRLDAEPDLATFEPHAKRPWSTMKLLVRTTIDPASVVASVTEELRATESNILIEDVQTMSKRISLSVAPRRLNTLLLSIFALIALLCAIIGIYAVISFSVTERTREIGIRLALGAQKHDVLRLVINQGMQSALIGIVIGLLIAFALTRLLVSLLFAVSATDIVTFTIVPLILLIVALAACYLPARRAAKTNPLIALRYE